MPLELGIWRIDDGLKRMQVSSLELESRLEDTGRITLPRGAGTTAKFWPRVQRRNVRMH